MSRLLNNANALALYFVSLQDEEKTDLTRSQFNWSAYLRQPNACRWNYNWLGLWTPPQLQMQDQRGIIGADGLTLAGFYENMQQQKGGQGKYFYISGYIQDENGNPVVGAVVQCFRTSDDLFTMQSLSQSDGSYSVGTPFSAVNHYLVAYSTGSPDKAGTTVNTLQPT